MKEGTPCKRMLVKVIGIDAKTFDFKVAENKNFTEQGCTGEAGKCGCTHAEINLLKIMPNPDFVIVTHSPCLNCAKALVKAGVKKVGYVNTYRLKDGIEFLEENGIEVIHIS